MHALSITRAKTHLSPARVQQIVPMTAGNRVTIRLLQCIVDAADDKITAQHAIIVQILPRRRFAKVIEFIIHARRLAGIVGIGIGNVVCRHIGGENRLVLCSVRQGVGQGQLAESRPRANRVQIAQRAFQHALSHFAGLQRQALVLIVRFKIAVGGRLVKIRHRLLIEGTGALE